MYKLLFHLLHFYCIHIYFLAITAGQGRDIQIHGLEVSIGCNVPLGHRKLILLQAFVLSPLNINKSMHVVLNS